MIVSTSDLPKQECRWEWQFHMMGRNILIGHPQWVWPAACARAYPVRAGAGTPTLYSRGEEFGQEFNTVRSLL